MDDPVQQLITESVTATPGRLGEILRDLAGLYSRKAEMLKNILVFKADRWRELRPLHKSDKSTDREWDSTREGKDEIRLRWEMKYMEKAMSSIKTDLRVKEVESRNIY